MTDRNEMARALTVVQALKEPAELRGLAARVLAVNQTGLSPAERENLLAQFAAEAEGLIGRVEPGPGSAGAMCEARRHWAETARRDVVLVLTVLRMFREGTKAESSSQPMTVALPEV